MKKITILILCYFSFNVSLATTVKEISIDELALNAELIFEGRCISIETKEVLNSRFIKTVVTFEIIDVIKGNYPDETIELEYLGGKLGGRELKVGDMKLPAFNEQGIFFVETLSKQLVHPLLGWEQGHIAIHRDSNGVERVGTADHKPIISLKSKSERQLLESGVIPISKGVARGIHSVESINWETALNKQDFKNKVKDIINKQ